MAETPSGQTPVVVARLRVLVDRQSAADAAKQVADKVSERVNSAVAASGASGAAPGVRGPGSPSGPAVSGTPQGATGGPQRRPRTLWETATARLATTGPAGRQWARFLRNPSILEDSLRSRAMQAGGVSSRIASMVPAGAGVFGLAALAGAVALGVGKALADWTSSRLSKMMQYAGNSPLMSQVNLEREFRERRREYIAGNRLAPSARFLNKGFQFASDQWAEYTSFWQVIGNYIGGALSYIWGGVLKIVNYLNPMHWFTPGEGDPFAIYRKYWESIIFEGGQNPVVLPAQPRRSPRPGGPGSHSTSGGWTNIGPRA